MSNSDETMFLVCKDNHIRMIDLNFLKTCEYLRGALIFLRLFNLDEDNPFKNLDMHTDRKWILYNIKRFIYFYTRMGFINTFFEIRFYFIL